MKLNKTVDRTDKLWVANKYDESKTSIPTILEKNGLLRTERYSTKLRRRTMLEYCGTAVLPMLRRWKC